MIIDFIEVQKHKFAVLAEKIMAEPKQYLDFETVSDFYKATWLNDFPQGTTWLATGLDDGADEFCIQIKYKDQVLNIEIQVDLLWVEFQHNSVKIKK